VAASCGVAGFQADDGQCADDLLINADLALFQAKESGRGQVQVFRSDSGLHEKVKARLLWSERIRDALNNDGFVLHAKPVIDLLTDAVAFYELVIRLKGPGGILIPPTVFLYTAERFGMAVEIDQWVTAQAIDLLERLQAQPSLALAVNISASSLQSDVFITFLRQALTSRHVEPSRLIFEVGEAVAMANLERYVRDLGGTLLMVGGERSFGPGGFDNTLLEEISPVTFDMQRQRNQPSLAMLLVIDRSGSMDGLKLEMAKDAAQAVVEMLGPQDAIGVIAQMVGENLPHLHLDQQVYENTDR
jgi:hypothetical protein